MNQINGYCQIDIPKSAVTLATITSSPTSFDVEVRKMILKSLGLDKIKLPENYLDNMFPTYKEIENRLARKPIVISIYPDEYSAMPVVVSGFLQSNLFIDDFIEIVFMALHASDLTKCQITLDAGNLPESGLEYYDCPINIQGKKITTIS